MDLYVGVLYFVQERDNQRHDMRGYCRDLQRQCGFKQAKEMKFLTRRDTPKSIERQEVPHIEPELNQMEDLPPMIPLHRYGLHKLGEHRRSLAKEQKRTYRSVQDWATEQVRRSE